jgi:hypothetical protein
MTRWNEAPTVDDLRAQVKAAHDNLRAAQQAMAAKDAGRLEAVLTDFRKAFAPVGEVSKRPAR